MYLVHPTPCTYNTQMYWGNGDAESCTRFAFLDSQNRLRAEQQQAAAQGQPRDNSLGLVHMWFKQVGLLLFLTVFPFLPVFVLIAGFDVLLLSLVFLVFPLLSPCFPCFPVCFSRKHTDIPTHTPPVHHTHTHPTHTHTLPTHTHTPSAHKYTPIPHPHTGHDSHRPP